MSKKTTPEPTNRSDGEKKRFLEEHFWYEIWMFVSAVDALAQFMSLQKNQIYINMALEDVLVHGRPLREFFYREDRAKDDDARPMDFVEDYDKWKRERPEETCWIKKIDKRASKEIVHLTYARLDVVAEEKKWDCEAIRNDFLNVVKVFLENVDKRHWSSRLSEIQNRYLS